MAPRRRRVVVLTHNSNIFLQREIDSLARVFDEVVILAWVDDGAPLSLPPNAVHLGSFGGFAPSRWQHLRRFLSPRFLGPFLRVAAHEVRRRRSLRRWASFVWACLLGAHIADLPGLRAAVSAPDRDVTVYSFWASDPSYAIPWLGPLKGGWVVRHHSADLYEWASGYLPLWPWIAEFADFNLFVSEHAMTYALKRAPGIAPRSQVRILGSVDGGIGPVPGAGIPTVVSCSSLAPVKRVPLLARALAQLGMPVRWVHLGSGPEEAQVRDALTSAELVEFELRGQVDHDEVLRFFQETPVSVFVNVSDREGVAVSICEALSFDIPVVATAAGGTPEIIGRELGTGILVPLDTDEHTLAAAIAEVIAAGRHGFTPRQEWERRLNAEANADSLAEWLFDSAQWKRQR